MGILLETSWLAVDNILPNMSKNTTSGGTCVSPENSKNYDFDPFVLIMELVQKQNCSQQS